MEDRRAEYLVIADPCVSEDTDNLNRVVYVWNIAAFAALGAVFHGSEVEGLGEGGQRVVFHCWLEFADIIVSRICSQISNIFLVSKKISNRQSQK
jgi:hypothetical protein